MHLSSVRCAMMDTFGRRTKGRMFNHRKPLKYRRFQKNLDPEKIVAHYSRDDLDQLDPRKGERTYKDARSNLGRAICILPNLNEQDLKANELFQIEHNRQKALIARMDKIKVIIENKPYNGTELIMNKYISTPYDCARSLSESLTTRSVVAEINNLDEKEENKCQFWDMHRPLEESCKLRLRHFVEDDLKEVNKIYWRSCSLVLGIAIRMAFKDEVKVLLHSWPKPQISSGSFVYDVALNLKETWTPSESELRNFSKVLWTIKEAALPFERLSVKKDVAKEMFSSNPLKLNAIDSIAEGNENSKVNVYRCGGYLDLSVGPMISNTGLIGRISLASVHNYKAKEGTGLFYRFQGVSVPQQLPISSYLYQNMILNKARELNRVSL